MKHAVVLGAFFLFHFFIGQVAAGQDTTFKVSPKAVAIDSAFRPLLTDSTKKKKRSPQAQAGLRSAILPGWGQIYNKKYWKLPLVYAAVGIPAYTYFYNKDWFSKTRYAYRTVLLKDDPNYLELLAQVDPALLALVERGDAAGLQNYRDEFRRNMDYSILAFLLLWGLNVMDAAVDAHLKNFDISDDLSIRFKPVLGGSSGMAGIGIVMSFGPRGKN